MRYTNPVMMSALNAANNQASDPLDASQLMTGSIQAVFSSSGLSGTLTLQGSNVPVNLCQVTGTVTPAQWNTIGSASVVASGAVTMQTVAQLNYRWIRVIWTKDAGAGTITVYGMFLGF